MPRSDAAHHFACDGGGGVRVIDRVGGIGTEIGDEMSRILKMCDQFLLQFESGMI
jgi:hypothetical protein